MLCHTWYVQAPLPFSIRDGAENSERRMPVKQLHWQGWRMKEHQALVARAYCAQITHPCPCQCVSTAVVSMAVRHAAHTVHAAEPGNGRNAIDLQTVPYDGIHAPRSPRAVGSELGVPPNTILI